LQAGVLAATVWFIFEGLSGDPARHFYLLFVPLIWIAARSGMNGAIVATAIVQIGVVIGIHGRSISLSIVELQALVAALTLTGLFLGVIVDERQRAEEGLRQTLRLAAAGEMAGAIAHEVNQPLTALANYGRSAQMLLTSGADASRLNEIIDKMLAEADRASDVVRRLRDFFRAGSTRLEEVHVPALFAAARRIGEGAIGTAPIGLEFESEQRLPPLFIDKLQIELVLRNLLANAVDSLVAAKKQGGRIKVSAQRDGVQSVRITVVDNGPGIAPATRDGLFEPFKSGKPSGMGLGLAVSRAIAEAHGGSLEASAAEHGEFHLVLPCVQSA
jgi:C4-dicarboxylate-specific signal transduction histidine kinase